MRSAGRFAVLTAIAVAAAAGLLGQSAAVSAAPATVKSWGTGSCPSFLPASGAFAPPGNVDTAWAPLQAEAIAQTEALYGITSDPSSLYAEDYARGITRAFMFADLVQAIDDVAAGNGTATQTSEVQAFEKVVQYGREWVAIDTGDLFSDFSNASAIQSGVTSDIMSVLFGYIGLPWQNESEIPTVTELLNQAQDALWGPPVTAVDDSGNQVPNFPIDGAEAQQARQQALEALVFLSAVGQTQLHDGLTGTNPSLDSGIAQLENAIGLAGGAGDLSEAVVHMAEIGAAATGTEGIEHASLIESLVNIVWQGANTAATAVQINDNKTASQALPSAADLQGALANAATFDELFSDFVAMTLHTLPNAQASGNDPDCRMVDKVRDGATPLGPTGSDPTMQVQHVTTAGTADYSYATQTLGGGRTDAGNSSGEISDPAVTDWSLTRDTGSGAPRVGTNWPVTEVTYGFPGPPGSGYLLRSPSPYYPASGSWYLTFNGANGQQHQTAPLSISVDSNGTVHPTDSEVEQAIINADPQDFPQQPCPAGPSASDEDPAVPAADQGQGPCTDWNPQTFNGTDLLVSGNQQDGNRQTPPDYQVIFDIMVKGDLGGWDPVFTAHTETCGNGGICVFTILGAPLVGENITSQTIWPQQQDDICVNDPHTCGGNRTFGWGDQIVDSTGDLVPQPYPLAAECQAMSPVAGLLQLQYVGQAGGNPDCNAAPDAGSWVMSPSVRYQSYFGSDWTAWRVPSSVGTSSFLNIETAAFSPGTAGIDPKCGVQASGSENAICLEGKGTHWLSDFAAGDQILLYAPSDPSGNGTGGLRSFVRTVGTVIDDTHMLLSTSAECLTGSDGNDCDFFNTSAYTSFMNPANGQQGDQSGMLTLPCGDGCVIAPTDFQFDIKKLTGLDAGTNCGTWAPSPSAPHPPTSGCYYSDTLQFIAQDGSAPGWWNVTMPDPPGPAVARQHAGQRPQAPLAGDGPWINAPKVTSQPQDVSAGAGGTAAFTVAAKGTPAPKIQWQVSKNHAASWANITGATAATLSVAVTAAESGDDYRAVLSNANGTATTQWGTLNVVSAPVITKNPASTKTLHRGGTFSFSSAATGDPAPAPTWEVSQDGGKTWQVLETGRPDVSFSLPAAPPAAAIRRTLSAVPAVATPDLVRVVYQNAYGTAVSSTAKINFTDTFPDVSPAVSVTPAPAAAGSPATAVLTLGNHSGVRATGVKAVATFSSSLALASLKQISGPKASCAIASVTGGKAATCTWAALAGHTQAVFHASLRPQHKAKTGAISVRATLDQANGALGSTTVTVPIAKPWADLQLTGTAPKAQQAGAAFADVLTIRDAGPAAASKAKVTVTVPAVMRLVKAAGSGATCTVRKAVVSCTIARLPAGRAIRITLRLKGVKKGAATLLAQVSATTTDYLPTSNSLSLSTAIK